MNSLFLLALAACSTLCACASTRAQPQRSCFHQNESIETDIGFCQALRNGNTLNISGIAGQGDLASARSSVY
jgi:hypothetical protein